MILVGPGGVGLGHLAQGQGDRLDDHVVDRELDPLGRAVVELLAGGQQGVELAVHRQVEVGYGLLGLGQAARHRLAHVGVLDLGVGLAEGLGQIGRRGARRRRRLRSGRRCGRCGRCRGRRCSGNAAGDSRLHIGLDDPPVGPTALQGGQVQARLLGDAPGQGAGEHPPGSGRGGSGGRGGSSGLGSRRCGRCRRGGRCRRRGRGGRRRGLGGAVAAACQGAVGSRGILAIFQEHADHLVDRHVLGALADHDLAEHALVHRLDLHGGLVGLDLGDHIAGAHRVALLLEPGRKGAFGHGGREGRHQDLDGHRNLPGSIGGVSWRARYSIDR